jgi:uncharacterized protein YprB with RNaseH-like and TPR domain
LGVYFGSKDLIDFKPRDKININNLPGVRKTNSFGEFFFVEHEFSPNYQHGAIPFEKFFNSKTVYSTPESDNPFNLNKCIFLDTETTGLSTTGGTFAFMVGVGWFENDHFLLRQYFLTHPDQEEAMLLDLENIISFHENIVSYNGISFDIPILKFRYKYHRIPTTIPRKKQIDLLKYARMLFRYQFEDRSLRSIESKVLRFQRAEQEIPGYLAPIIYQDFLKTGNIQDITGVFYHNEMDVVSLAALISIVNEVSDENERHFFTYDTLHYSLARQFDKNRNYSKAIDYYLRALEQPKLPNVIRVTTLLSLANLYKKTEQLDKAMPVWQNAAALGSIEALIEMAKVLEHKQKEYKLAMDCCKKVLFLLNNDVNSIKRVLLTETIEYRMDRLKAKGKL